MRTLVNATLSAAMILSTGSALAQAPAAVPARAPTPYAQAPAPAPVAAPAAAIPEPPDPPAAIASNVVELRRVVARTSGCWSAHGERVEHTADRRCPAWYARLSRGGAATVYAIGGVLTNPTREERELMDSDEGNFGETAERLFRIMAATGSETAVPYLLAYIQRSVSDNGVEAGVSPAFDALATVTGNDVSSFVPWQDRWDRSEEGWRQGLARWAAWYNTHRAASRAEWVAEGLTRARADLASGEPAVAFAAARRLAAVPAERPAAVRTIQSVLARADLPSEARAFITRYARRNRIAVRGTNAVARGPVTARR